MFKPTLIKGGKSYEDASLKTKIAKIFTSDQKRTNDAHKAYEKASDAFGDVLGKVMRGEAKKGDVVKAVTAYDRAIEGLKSTSSFNKEV